MGERYPTVCVSHSVMSDSLRPHELQSTRLLCPQDSPGKNTGVTCHSLLRGIFPTKGLNPGFPNCWQILDIRVTKEALGYKVEFIYF